MAGNPTTHVIEIEKGVGEPTFIPLSTGSELAPISVGRRGMWRIEGAKVLDVHAFIYFDGQSLFVQSADAGQAALAEGTPVGSQWTELRAPCRIDLGSARLSYRSLLEDPAEAVATVAREVTKEEREAFAREVAARRTASAAPPPPPVPQAKANRPFAHGELATKGDSGESTRYNPVDSGSSAAQPRAMPRRTVSGPSAAPPVEVIPGSGDETRIEVGPRAASGGYPRASPPAVPRAAPSRPAQSRPAQGQMPSYIPQQLPPPQPQAPTIPPPYASPSGMPAHTQMLGMQGQMVPPSTMPGMGVPMGMPMPSGGYQAAPTYPGGGYAMGGGYPGAPGMPAVGTGPGPMMMPPQVNGAQTVMVNAQGGSGNDLAAQFRAASPVRKAAIILAPLAALAAVYILFSDDDPGPMARAGIAPVTSIAQPGTMTSQSFPPGTYPLGPPGVVLTAQPSPPPGMAPAPGTTASSSPLVQPQAPQQAVVAVATQAQPSQVAPTQPPPTPAPAPARSGSTVTSGPPTTERRAVDAVLLGDNATAYALYQQLVREHPENPAFANAARILKARVDGASPR